MNTTANKPAAASSTSESGPAQAAGNLNLSSSTSLAHTIKFKSKNLNALERQHQSIDSVLKYIPSLRHVPLDAFSHSYWYDNVEDREFQFRVKVSAEPVTGTPVRSDS